MKDIRKKGLLSCAFVMTVILAMTGTGCQSGGDKEEVPKSCLAGEACRLSMEAASAFEGLWEGLQSLQEEVSVMLQGKKLESQEVYVVGMDNGETNDFYARVDGTEVFFSEVESNPISEELTEYLVQALQEGELIESLKEIEAEYEVLGEEEKQVFDLDLPEEERGIGLALYYPSIRTDNWYRVSLTDEGDDIIVEHVGEDGCTVNYFFWNIEGWHTYSDVPLRAGGQPESCPYFIEWDGENYLAIPYWDRGTKNIIGIVVYKFGNNYGGGVLAVGKNSDSSICVIPQTCGTVARLKYLPYNATKWPIVVRY